MTVAISSRWRALLSLILAGTVIAIASLYPRLQLPGVGEPSRQSKPPSTANRSSDRVLSSYPLLKTD